MTRLVAEVEFWTKFAASITGIPCASAARDDHVSSVTPNRTAGSTRLIGRMLEFLLPVLNGLHLSMMPFLRQPGPCKAFSPLPGQDRIHAGMIGLAITRQDGQQKRGELQPIALLAMGRTVIALALRTHATN